MEHLPQPEPERPDVPLTDEAYNKTNAMLFMLVAFYAAAGMTALAAWGGFLIVALVFAAVSVGIILRLLILGNQLDDLLSQTGTNTRQTE